jgi:hypothetical protein
MKKRSRPHILADEHFIRLRRSNAAIPAEVDEMGF